MSRSDEFRISDITSACGEMASLVELLDAGVIPSAVLTRAAERILEIIGEAATAMSDTARGRYPEVPWRDVMRLRVILAHHYQRVDPDQVWSIARRDIPRLAALLQGSTP